MTEPAYYRISNSYHCGTKIMALNFSYLEITDNLVHIAMMQNDNLMSNRPLNSLKLPSL